VRKNYSSPLLKDCWAKTYPKEHPAANQTALTVSDHCHIVGHVACELIKKLAPSVASILPAGTTTLIAAHDVGKLSPGFQLKCPEWSLYETVFSQTQHNKLEKNHASVSQSHLQQSLGNSKSRLWLTSTGGHHGSYPFGYKTRINPSNEGGNNSFIPLRHELLNLLIAEFGPLPIEPATKLDKHRVHLLTGLTIFADWLGSNTDWFPLGWNQQIDSEKIALKTQEILQGLRFHSRSKSNLTFGQLFNPSAPTQFQPRALQSTLIEAADSTGLYIVEAPMGLGKTEAALAASYQLWEKGHNRGLYFALPTQLTSEKIHTRIQNFLQEVTDVETVQTLIHGNAWLKNDNVRALSPHLDDDPQKPERDHNDTDEALRWFSTSRRQLLAPFGTGTIDQALLAVLPARFAALRFFSLAGKVVVVDEVHSYDTYTSSLVDRLVEYLLKVGSTVIILSATLTAKRRAELVLAAGASEPSETEAYPLITKVAFGDRTAEHISKNLALTSAPVSVQLKTTSSNSPTLFDDIAQKVLTGANVVVIRNTVALAQETFRQIKSCLTEAIPHQHRSLIHSRFPQWKRQENEDKWMTLLGKDSSHRPTGSLLVSTQIVEQSVDIDADFLVTDLAPIDLLIQRIGRLHRHPRSRPTGFENPTCLVLHPEIDWASSPKEIETQLSPHRFIYPPLTLWQASKILTQKNSLTLPHEIRSTLEAAHALLPPPNSPVDQFLADAERKEIEQRATAKQRDIFASAIDDIEGKETRYGIQPSGFIVLLKSPPEVRQNQITLTFLHGPPVTLRPGQFSFPLARALHLNAIRIPRYLIKTCLSDNPDWLDQHLSDSILATITDASSELQLTHASSPTHNFHYHQDSGLTYQKSTPEATRYDSFEEDFIL
jgi:CRISPR-associated endonuclease/helicase Cas3